MSTAEQELEALVTAIQQNLTNTYVNVSAISFLVYDILINLDKEVQHVWSAKWSVSKILFIFGRYYGLLFNITNLAVTTTLALPLNFCRGWMWFVILGGEITFSTVVNVIVSMRLYALYRSRKVLVFFVFMLICEFAFELYVCIKMAIEVSDSVTTLPPGIPLPGCIAYPETTFTLMAWIPCIFVATVFFLMTIVKIFGDVYGSPKQLENLKHISPLIASFIRDGAVFYFLMLAIVVASLVLNQTSRGMAMNLPMPWLIAIYSLSASRLVLNLREAASRTDIGPGTTTFSGSQTMTAPVFAFNSVRAARETDTFL